MPVDDPEIQAAAESIFEDMLSDLILDVTISAQREIKRGRVVCGTCGTRCRAHLPLMPSNGASSSTSLAPVDSSSFSSSRAASPASAGPSSEGRTGGYKVGPEKGTGGSTGIGSGSGKIDGNGNAFFDCLVCNRAIASTRYAPHLSSCLGLSGSTRRTAARSAAVKARLGANDRSSPSPYAQSENGDSDNESVSSKKGKKLLNGNGKRGRSPSKTPSIIGKKSKFSSGTATPSAARPILPPSKLGQPPTNRPPTQLSSPVSSGSPEFSIVSSQGTVGASSKKKLPEPDYGKGLDADDVAAGGEYVPGDDSSDEGADDY